MHAYLIVSLSEEVQKEEIEKLSKSFKTQNVEYPLKKVEDVREILQFLKLKIPNTTGVVIYSIDDASTETQNAFLKPLEEPQQNIVFFLTAKSRGRVLPTIQSRCQIVEITSKGDHTEAINRASDFIKKTTGEKMQIVSKIKKRDEAISFLEELLLGGNELMQNDTSLVKFCGSAHVAHKAIKANGNIFLQLTKFVSEI